MFLREVWKTYSLLKIIFYTPVTHTHRDLYFFTNKGRVLILKGFSIPETRTGKGKQISRLLPLEEGERVVTLSSGDLEGLNYVFFLTKKGMVARWTLVRSLIRSKQSIRPKW